MRKEEKILKLIECCKEIHALNKLQKEKTAALQEMARLAREGLKDSREFKNLQFKYQGNTVIDFSTVVGEVCRIVEKL